MRAGVSQVSAYWKFSIFTDSVDETRARLVASGWDVTEPLQFRDIGYLCHAHDADGLAVELLQRTFVPPRPRPDPVVGSSWFSGRDTLGLITLRVSALEAELSFYQSVLGMKLLAIMDVDDVRPDPFTLYFLGFTAEEPPSRDPESVDNREWLYHRPYTLIELQHYRPADGEASRRIVTPPASVPGFSHIMVKRSDTREIAARARAAGTACNSDHDSLTLYSPQGHRFVVFPEHCSAPRSF
jgi:catechol 2,3-dioxygenase-like lactoylglutathione lyase family enzyme